MASTGQQQSHSKFASTTSMRVLALRMRVCDVCAMIRKHVACATTAAVLLEVNNTWFLLNTASVFSLNNTATHAPCFLQHVTCVSLFNLAHPRELPPPTSRRGTLYMYILYNVCLEACDYRAFACRMTNRHGLWVCWMSMGGKSSFKHTHSKEQRGTCG